MLRTSSNSNSFIPDSFLNKNFFENDWLPFKISFHKNHQQSLLSNPEADWLADPERKPVDGVLKTKNITPPNQIKLAYWGVLNSNSGVALLINSLAALPATGKFILDIWGTGKEETSLKQLVKSLSLGRKVNFKGSYPKDKAGAELMITYDALVLTPTKTKGLPFTLIESMAYGLPFLTTNTGAISNCCINNPDAILVSPTQDNIIIGLSVLINFIENNSFDPARLRRYYESKFLNK